MSNFEDDENTLPHCIDTTKLSLFRGVQIPLISYRKSVDLLNGQLDKFLLTVLEEREGFNSNEPNYVLTRLGAMASGGRMDTCSNLINSRRAVVNVCKCDARECENLRLENASLKENLRKIELKDEELLPSREDDMARSLVEPNIKVVNGRFEMPVPLKAELVETLPDNYELALKRTLSLRTSAVKNPVLKQTLIDTFSELIKEGWIESVDNVHSVSPKWYLPYFVTKLGKPRVVYDGAATFGGVFLNQAVLAGTNLLNNLVEVLTRFRLGKFACMADLSKCFFQVAVPEAQRDLFRIIWFSNGDLEAGTPQVFRFSRHVWEINSSPYAALLAIKTLISEDPTSASDVTLSVVDKNRYMDDVLYSNNSLSELEKVARESTALFNSRGFKPRKWISNSCAKAILTEIPQCDLAPSISEVTIGAEPMPDSKSLGVIWNVENDKLKVSFNKNFSPVTTRRQMASQLASNYDPHGVASPCLLGGKLILQRVATAKIAWDDKLPADIIENWNSWISSLKD